MGALRVVGLGVVQWFRELILVRRFLFVCDLLEGDYFSLERKRLLLHLLQRSLGVSERAIYLEGISAQAGDDHHQGTDEHQKFVSGYLH